MAEIGVGRISTVAGRYYGMDRDNRWDRIEKEYNACVLGDGIMADDAVEAVRKSYETVDADGKHLTDEFVIPTVIAGGKGIADGDSIIFFNTFSIWVLYFFFRFTAEFT